jgi:hypothetical protein
MISRFGKLPITTTGMISHGHGDERYMHNIPTNYGLILFEHFLQNKFFACLLQGKLCYKFELKTPSQSIGPKPLLKKLLFQMDNCVKENKNRYLLAFLSLLITREMCKEFKLAFHVGGYTHEDIDGCLGICPKS